MNLNTKYKPSNFISNFSLQDLLKNLHSPNARLLGSCGGGGGGTGTGTTSLDQEKPFVTTKSDSFSTSLEFAKLQDFSLSEYVYELLNVIENDLKKNNFQIKIDWIASDISEIEYRDSLRVNIEYQSNTITGEIVLKAHIYKYTRPDLQNFLCVSINAYLVESSYSTEPVIIENPLPSYIPSGKYYVVSFAQSERKNAQDFFYKISNLAKESNDEISEKIRSYCKAKDNFKDNFKELTEKFNAFQLKSVELAMYRYEDLPENLRHIFPLPEINKDKLLPSSYEPLTMFYFFNEGILQMLIEAGEKPNIIKTVSANCVAKLNDNCFGGSYLSKEKREEFYKENNFSN